MTDTLRRHIGLGGAVFTLVGYVIGASIFVLPGQLGAQVGPGLFLSFAVAGGLAVLACLASAHLGGQFPVSGAIYVAIGKTIGPRAAFLSMWLLMLAITVGVPLIAFGMVDYLVYFVPGLPRTATALGIVFFFGLVNLVPVRQAVLIQVAMTVALLVIVYAFGLAALPHIRTEQFTPLFPNGVGAVLGSAVAAYFSFLGFMVIADIAEEIKDPDRTIPRALLISFLIVIVAYMLIAVAVPGLLDWRTLGSLPAPVASAAETFLPRMASNAIAIAAILAAATSVHGVLLVHARDVFALARDSVFPETFAQLSPGGIPRRAVVLLTGVSLLGTLLGRSILDYAVLSALGVMTMQAMAGVAVLRHATVPGRFGLRSGTRKVVGVLFLVTSVLFGTMGAMQRPGLALGFGVTAALGFLYYVARGRVLARRGIRLDHLIVRQQAS